MNKETLDKIVAAWSKLTPEQKVSELEVLRDTEWYNIVFLLNEFGTDRKELP